MNQREYIVTPPLARTVEYEYAVQWLSGHHGWLGHSWGILEDAQLERKQMVTGVWPKDEVRIVRRVKAGPIEVVE